MERREFMQRTAAGMAALTLPSWTIAGKETKMGIVVHSYAFRWNSKIPSAKYPGFTTAIELLQHTADIGAGGIQVVVNGWDTDFAKKVRDLREKLGLYLEGSISMPSKQEDVASLRTNCYQCEGGRRYCVAYCYLKRPALRSVPLRSRS
ncbi:MAG: hypothetical protein WDO15_26155 [Bacteroidota bacterium]